MTLWILPLDIKLTLIRRDLSTKHEGGCSGSGSGHVRAIVVRFLAERQLSALRTSVRDAEVLGPVRPDVFVPRQISSVKIYEEESEAAHQYTRRAEVVTSFPAATDVHVSCKNSPTLNPLSSISSPRFERYGENISKRFERYPFYLRLELQSLSVWLGNIERNPTFSRNFSL